MDEWRLAASLRLTEERRPDLFAVYRAAHPPKPEKKRRKRIASPAEDASAPTEEGGFGTPDLASDISSPSRDGSEIPPAASTPTKP